MWMLGGRVFGPGRYGCGQEQGLGKRGGGGFVYVYGEL